MLRRCLLATLVGFLPAVAQAQSVDIGVTLSDACRGTDGSVCGPEHFALPAVSAAIWLGRQMEIQTRIGQGHLDNRQYDVPRDGRFQGTSIQRMTVFREDRRHRFGTVEWLWNFRPEHRVRPFVGIGFGSFVVPRRHRCDPAGCERILELIDGPDNAATHRETTASVGLTIRATDRLRVRLGWTGHNFAADEVAMVEWGLGVAWRLRR